MITRVGVRKIGLCATIAVFAVLLVIGMTWGGKGPGGPPDGGDGGPAHTSDRLECTVCHPENLKDLHFSDCDTCHIPPGKQNLLVPGASFDCRDCHDLSGDPYDYHEGMDGAHTPPETSSGCMTPCHDVNGGLLTDIHADLEWTVSCPAAVVNPDDDDIFCYCLECHIGISELPGNAECATCHEDYDPRVGQCPHEDEISSHDECIVCHEGPCPQP